MIGYQSFGATPSPQSTSDYYSKPPKAKINRQSLFCNLLRHAAVQSLWPSHILTPPRGFLSARLLHAEQCGALKIHKLFIWRADMRYLFLPFAPVLESQTPAGLPVLRSSKGQRTVAFLTELSSQDRDTFVTFVGGCHTFCITARTVIFYSTGSRASQTT